MRLLSRVAAAALCAWQFVAWWHGTAQWTATGLLALAAVPVVVLVVGWLRDQDGRQGPDIHDRQLDHIVAAGAGVVAAVLLLAGVDVPAHRLELLALPATVIAVLALVVGSRRLWQLRAVPLALLLAWPLLWQPVSAMLAGPLGPGAADGAVSGTVLAMAVVLSARASWWRKLTTLALAGVVGALAEIAISETLAVGWDVRLGTGHPVVPALVAVVVVAALARLMPLRLYRPLFAPAWP